MHRIDDGLNARLRGQVGFDECRTGEIRRPGAGGRQHTGAKLLEERHGRGAGTRSAAGDQGATTLQWVTATQRSA